LKSTLISIDHDSTDLRADYKQEVLHDTNLNHSNKVKWKKQNDLVEILEHQDKTQKENNEINEENDTEKRI